MASDNYVVAFNILNAPYQGWVLWMAFGITVVVTFFTVKVRPLRTRLLAVEILLLSGILFAWPYTYFTHLGYRQALQLNHTSYVEGLVENYEPEANFTRKSESFEVKGIPFQYSSGVTTQAFNQTALHGGPVRPGAYVRIWYVDNSILKMEIRQTAQADH